MKYLVKMAWTSCHPQYGKLISFLVTPYKETTPSSWGYTIDDTYDEVFRLSYSTIIDEEQILKKLTKVSDNQWELQDLSNLVETHFNSNDFFEEEIYQENFRRNVLFHTSKELL